MRRHLLLALGCSLACYLAWPSLQSIASSTASWLSSLALVLLGVAVTYFAGGRFLSQWQTRYAASAPCLLALLLSTVFHVLLVRILHDVCDWSWLAAGTVAWCSFLVTMVAGAALWGALTSPPGERDGAAGGSLRQWWLEAQIVYTERLLVRQSAALSRAKQAGEDGSTSPAAIEERIGALVAANPAFLVAHRARLLAEVGGLRPDELAQRRRAVELELKSISVRLEALQDPTRLESQVARAEARIDQLEHDLQRAIEQDPGNLSAKVISLRRNLAARDEGGSPQGRPSEKLERIVREQDQLSRQRQAALATLEHARASRQEAENLRQLKELELLAVQLAGARSPESRDGERMTSLEESIAESQLELDRLRARLGAMEVGCVPATTPPCLKKRLA